MRSRLSIATLLLLAASTVAAQQPAPNSPAASVALSPATPLPVDPKVKIGTLPNGIRYYIRKNAKPEKRAELRLVVNAGSILEADDQRGMAHVLEHTGFNGTRNFAKNDLIKYLESIGVRFGADLNAYTGFDETVFILPVPTDSAHILDKAFLILEDWAHGQIFDSAEVMSERGIVREEWRGSKGASERMLQQWLPIAFRGSRYAERLPIGTEQSIMSVTPAKLRAFYRDWYRPDLMAVIAVGDFEPAAIEAKIRKHFSGIEARPNAPRRTVFDIPVNKAPLVAIATDREATQSSVNLIYKLPATTTRNVGDYRRLLAERLYIRMLNARFAEIAQKPDAPFLGAGASKDAFFGRNVEAFTLAAGVKDGGIEEGVESLLTEARRVDQYGFLQTELDRARQDVLRGLERSYAERDKTLSASHAQEYIGNYLQSEAIPGIEYEYSLARGILPQLTLAEVNRLGSGWIGDENRVIIVQVPLKEGVVTPTEKGILAVFQRASTSAVTAYTESLSGDALIDVIPAPGKIAGTRAIPSIAATEWKLSNGARVIVKPTDFKDDEILFGAFSAGGTSLASDPDYVSAFLAGQIVPLGGAGKFSQIDLGKKLSGKAVRVSPSITEVSEGFSGQTSPKDVETFFQLIHLQFTAPRMDTAVFTAFRNQVGPFLANRSVSPEAVFQDTVQVTMSQRHFRARPFTPAVFGEASLEKAFAFYKSRYADAGDFTFVFVGNVDTASLKPLVERYLATLPSSGRKEAARDNGGAPPKGIVEKTVRKGVEPKASTLIAFTGACRYSPENRFALRALATLLQIRLNETLREKLGGTYSPNVVGTCNNLPRQEYAIQIQYGSSPDNVDLLSRTVLALLDTLKTQPASQADVDKVKEQIVRTREVEVKQNSYWVANIMSREQAGEDLAGLLAPYDRMVSGLTAAQLQQAARTYFDTGNYARFVLLPEAPKTTP